MISSNTEGDDDDDKVFLLEILIDWAFLTQHQPYCGQLDWRSLCE